MGTNRRDFLKTGAVAATALSWGRILGANERIRLGAIGTGARCQYLLGLLKRLNRTDLVAVCDVYGPRRAEAKEKFGATADEYVDHRELLDRKDLDAVIIAVPDHWHVPITVDAVQAGKDIYLEKPVTTPSRKGSASWTLSRTATGSFRPEPSSEAGLTSSKLASESAPVKLGPSHWSKLSGTRVIWNAEMYPVAPSIRISLTGSAFSVQHPNSPSTRSDSSIGGGSGISAAAP